MNTCSINGCNNPHLARGMCEMHYRRHARTGSAELRELNQCLAEGCTRRIHAKDYCNAHLHKVTRYGTPFPYAGQVCQFCGTDISGPRKASTCKAPECVKASDRQRHARRKSRDPEGVAAAQSRASAAWRARQEPDRLRKIQQTSAITRHGITMQQYADLLEAQHGVCAICKRPPADKRKSRLVIDHDHSCCPGERSCGKCVRGLLCSTCNSGIGLFRDSADDLFGAAMYLHQYRFPSPVERESA